MDNRWDLSLKRLILKDNFVRIYKVTYRQIDVISNELCNSFRSRFCKVPPQLCDGCTTIRDICSSSSSSSIYIFMARWVLSRLAGGRHNVLNLHVQSFFVTSPMNMVFWKQMNWICCKLVQVVYWASWWNGELSGSGGQRSRSHESKWDLVTSLSFSTSLVEQVFYFTYCRPLCIFYSINRRKLMASTSLLIWNTMCIDTLVWVRCIHTVSVSN